MDKFNRTCLVCGIKYRYCSSCREYITTPQWKNLFHSENCKEVFHIVSDYLQGHMTKGNAIQALHDCDLSEKDKYKQNIKDCIDELLDSQVVSEAVCDITVDIPAMEEDGTSAPKQKPNKKKK